MTTGAMQLRHLDTGAVLLRFAQPVAQLTMNQRHHWRTARATARGWRTATAYVAQALQVPPQPAALVTVRLEVRRNLRRDPHNYFPTVKPIIDGLVDAKVWPDDTPLWVRTTEPDLIPVPTPTWQAIYVEVLITPRQTMEVAR